jgi:two-component sensor histidine kinase
MIHAMLYASSSLKDIDFAEYARVLATAVSNSYGIDPARIRLAFELEPLRLEIDRAIPCGLILNELLSNAFKYAFPNNCCGEIRVSLQHREHCIRLAVEDSGIGLPERSPSERKSLGLEIVNTLSEQLGGSLEITSNQGAHFVLTMIS